MVTEATDEILRWWPHQKHISEIYGKLLSPLFKCPGICTLLIQNSVLASFGILHRCGWSVLIVCVCRVCRHSAPHSTSGVDCSKNVPFLTPPPAPSTPLTSQLLRNHHNNPIHTFHTFSNELAWQTQKQMANRPSTVFISELLMKSLLTMFFYCVNNNKKKN